MKNKQNLNKDPFPITAVYHVTDTLVDAATVVVTDLCENLSNQIDIDAENILENLKKTNTKKFNSISVCNALQLTKDTNVKINGISNNTLIKAK